MPYNNWTTAKLYSKEVLLTTGKRADHHWLASGLVVLIVLAAFGLRIYRSDIQSLWVDEVASYYQAIYFFSAPEELVSLVQETRVKAYALTLRPWALLIPNEFGLRWPSVLAGTVAVAIMYQIGRRIGTNRTGILASLLLAVAPLHVYYGQEARHYALMLLSSLTSLWLLLLADKNSHKYGLAYALSVMAAAAVHAVAALWLIVLSGWILVRRLLTGRGLSLGAWAATQVGLLLVLGIIYFFDPHLSDLFQPPTPNMQSLRAFYGAALGLWLAPGNSFGALLLLASHIAVLGMMILGVARLLQNRSYDAASRTNGFWMTLLLTTLIIGPLMGLFLISILWQSLWLPRYLIPSMAVLLSLAALSATITKQRWLAIIATAAILTGSFGSLIHQYYNPQFWRIDARGVGEYIIAHAQSDDGLYMFRLSGRRTVGYYLEGGPISLYGLEALHDSPDALTSETEAAIMQISKLFDSNGRVWAVWRAEWDDTPQDWYDLAGLDTVQLDYADYGDYKVYLHEKLE